MSKIKFCKQCKNHFSVLYQNELHILTSFEEKQLEECRFLTGIISPHPHSPHRQPLSPSPLSPHCQPSSIPFPRRQSKSKKQDIIYINKHLYLSLKTNNPASSQPTTRALPSPLFSDYRALPSPLLSIAVSYIYGPKL